MRLERRSVMDDMFGRPEKRCACCGRWLEYTQFNISKLSKDGLQSYCKRCQKAYHQKHPSKEFKHSGKDLSLPIQFK